jgi:outer membrane cobalamin receptor
MTLRRFFYPFFVITFLISVLEGKVFAQHSAGSVKGKIVLRQKEPAKRLLVRAYDQPSGTFVQEARPDETGNFILRELPFSDYDIYVLEENLKLAKRSVSVRSAVPVEITIDSVYEFEENVRGYSAQEVVVESSAPLDVSKTGGSTYFTAYAIEQLPTLSSAKRIESVLLASPGVVPDEDGRLHVRGEDAMLQYVIDGIPVTTNMTRVYSSLFNANLVKSADFKRGGLDAEYGVATAGVIAVTTKSGYDRPFFLEASGSTGSFETNDVSLEAGGNIGGRAALYFGANLMQTDRYLDPISSFDPIHGGGKAQHYFGKFNALITDDIELAILGGYNKTEYEIPNSLIYEVPEQDQKQKLNDYMVGARLNFNLSETALFSVLGYNRKAEAEVTSGGLKQIVTPADSAKAVAENEKFFIGGDRSNGATGGQAELSLKTDWLGKPNNFKFGAGGESYPLKEFFTFAITNPNVSNPDSGGDDRYIPYDLTKGGKPFLVDQSKTGKRYSAYVQDQIFFGEWTLSAGLRYDMFDLFEKESNFSPRIGATYAISSDLLLRASYNRVVLQAPVENILVSNSDEAKVLVGPEQGNTPTQVSAEKAHIIEIGGGYRLNNNIDFDLSTYGKSIDNFIVKSELGNSGVIFPINLKQGVVAGAELVARLHDWNNLSATLSVSMCFSKGKTPSDGSSPIAAGLILGEEGENYSHPFGGEDLFSTEHNQLLTSVLQTNYNHPSGFFATLGGRYDSGLPFDLADSNGKGLSGDAARAELKRRGYTDDVIDLLNLNAEADRPDSPDKSVAPHMTFDVGVGYDFERTLNFPAKISATVVNIFDTAYLYKFESSFGGTHFGVPRSFSVGLQMRY